VRRRWPALGWLALGLVLAATAHQTVQTGRMTRTVFGDGRIACGTLAGVAPGVVTMDLGMKWRCEQMPVGGLAGWTVRPLAAAPGQWPQQLAQVAPGYVVTGGGRRPTWHGGEVPVPRGDDVPAARASLLVEAPGPTSPKWRQEPLRIWYAWPPSATACTPPPAVPTPSDLCRVEP